jgi:hypothetical protein
MGISDNIKDGYRFLAGNYDEGDEIFIMGFSRGAYSARSLVGMIKNLGILRRENIYIVDQAYKRYRDRSQDWAPRGKKAVEFRKRYSRQNGSVRFLGVFDTVGALGVPFGAVLGWLVDKFLDCGFHDTQLSSIVENAYHAVSIDERRLPFLPSLMLPHPNHDSSNFEEKWFAGVHSDVGGGYRQSGLSDIPLKWMATKAQQNGLNVDLSRVSETPVNPDPLCPPNDSQTWFYRILSVALAKLPYCLGMGNWRYGDAVAHLRWNGDYIRPICADESLSDFIGCPPRNPNSSEYKGKLHNSVIDKINECWRQYRPPNIKGF